MSSSELDRQWHCQPITAAVVVYSNRHFKNKQSKMDKLLLLYADLRKRCQSENKRTKEVLSHSGHSTRSPWHLGYSPYQWGKQAFVGPIPGTFTDRPSSCGTTCRFLQKTLEKCGHHTLLCRLSVGLTRKKCLSEQTTSNVMLVSMRHSQVVETSYTSVGAKYKSPGRVPGPRTTGGRQAGRERRKEQDLNQGSFQEHLLSTRRCGQWSRQGREQNTTAMPCPSQSTSAQCPDRPGARQCPDRPGARQCPDRPGARQCPDRPRQLMKYVHSTVFVQKHRPRHNLMYFLGKILA